MTIVGQDSDDVNFKLAPKDADLIRNRLALPDKDLNLTIVGVDSPQKASLMAFCRALTRIGQRLHWRLADDAVVDLAAIRLGANVLYRAAPSGKELELFLDHLASPQAMADKVPLKQRRQLSNLEAPADLVVYFLPGCTFCPRIISKLLGLAAAAPPIRLTVIDGALFPELAAADQIKSVPTAILDGKYRWVGAFNIDELVDLVLERDPIRLTADVLRGMLADGQAQAVARMMIKRAAVFPAFIDLLCHPKWPVRLGAMVAYEYLAAEASPLAQQVVVPLRERFENADDGVRGDLLHVLGESGAASALEFIRSVLDGDHAPEVIDAAKDALK